MCVCFTNLINKPAHEKRYISHPWPAKTQIKMMVLLLFIHCFVVAPIVCGGLVWGLCFVLKCIVSFLVLQSSRYGSECRLCSEWHVTFL